MRGICVSVYRGAGGTGLAEALRRQGIVVGADDDRAVDALLIASRDLTAVRVADPATPVVVVDGPANPFARAELLDGGAADVLAAPTDPVELAAKLRALVRLGNVQLIGCADLLVDPLSRHAERGGKPLPLHPREFALLAALARQRDRPVERMALLGMVWRRRFDPGTNIVAVTVSRLRAKVDHGFARPLIHTVGSGYMLSKTAVAVR